MKKVNIFSTPSCTYCKMAKEFFGEKGVEFSDVDVSVDEEARNQMVEKSGQMGVPVIMVSDEDGSNEEIIVGFNEPKLTELLEL